MKRSILYIGVACMMFAAFASCKKDNGEDLGESQLPVVEKDLEGLSVKTTEGNFEVSELQYRFETDFAAKTDAFQNLVKGLAETVAVNDPADVEALKACNIYQSVNL